MPRKITPPTDVPAQRPTPADPPAGPAIRVDLDQMEILDLLLFTRLGAASDVPASEQNALIMEAIPMLDRLVVGGVKGYKLSQLGYVISAVSTAIQEASKAKN